MPASSRPEAAITGLGIFLPERVVSNDDLAKFLDTSDAWISERTGIRTRRVIDESMATSDMAIAAGRAALADAGVAPQEVDLVLVATYTEDYPFPSTASIVQNALGCTRAGAFDIETACTGWIAACSTAAMWVKGGGAKTVLVIGSDASTRALNWKDRMTAVIFGDAAAAAVVQASSGGMRILSTYLGSDGSGLKSLYQPAGGSRKPASKDTVEAAGHFIHMEGKATFKFAVKAMADSILEASRRASIDPGELKLVVPHQANARIIEAACKRLEMDMSKYFVNIDRYGNTVAASVCLALYEAREMGKIAHGDSFALVGMGAGLSWGGMAVRWIDSRGGKE